ncbi:MAG TPA: DUF1552 domain-containing protein [Polyangiaceae bacterium]|nr:DUF1552 domain-containing protein [Polyangiaceae bacterium]
MSRRELDRRAINRRRFLKAVGATALTYPFLRSLPSYAQPTSPPQYLILVFTPCGCVRPNWGAVGPVRPATGVLATPLTGAADGGGMGSFRVGPTGQSTLAALAPFASQTIVLDGMNVGTADGSHEAGMAALWTGEFNTGPGNGATTVSIDQAIAAQLAANNVSGYSNVAFQNGVALMVRSSEDFTDREVKTRMIYGDSGGSVGFVDPIDDPTVTRTTLFPNAATSGSSSSGPTAQSVIQAAVFAQTNQELTALQAKMCTEDRIQLQNYQAMWNQLDSQLQQAAKQAASCMPPEAIPSSYVSPPLTGPASEFPVTAKLQMDLLALAMACDLTRVGSIQFSTATSQVTHSWISSTQFPQTDIHHNYSHDGYESLEMLCPYGANPLDIYTPTNYQPGVSTFPLYMGQLAQIDIWYASQIAYLANALSQYTTTANQNLLAQTVICWGSELDMGSAHNHDDTPFVLVGGGGGKLKTGQLVQFPLNLANAAANSPPTNNRFHNDLLLTLAQVMGVNMTTFGSVTGTPPSLQDGGTVTFCTGPITQILAT